MNITLNNIDPVNATITVDVLKDDYAAEVKKGLKKIQETASIPGFRPGKVPASRVQAMYGKSVLVDEVNKLVSDKLYSYIRENELNVLGEPMPSEKEQKPLDFDNQEDYSFVFDIALAPDMSVKLTKSDKLPYYDIQISDEMVDTQINSYKANFGTYEQVENIEGKDMAKGRLLQLDAEGKPQEGGIDLDEAVLMPAYMKEDTEKAKFLAAQLNQTIVFNPYKAYDGSDVELSSFLKVNKEEVKEYTGDFSFEIKEITRYKEGELNQDLFDKVLGPDIAKTEEEFRAKIRETIASQLAPESDFRFLLDAKKMLEDKTADVQFPDEFLKRWLLASNTERTPESVEEDYPKIIADLKFHLIKEQIVKEKGIKVEAEDVMENAKKATRAQFAQYGMANVPENLIENYAQEMMKKEETVRNLVDRAVEDKLVSVLKEEVTLKPKKVTLEEFQKLFAEPEEEKKEVKKTKKSTKKEE
ncbi:trigger factor [Bacteroidales bacterium OttesenSCG-928-A17]|nr:trigger factor [Bacteroidales bacterium OttesenSCG-928-A17]